MVTNSNSFIQVPPDGGGRKVRTAMVTVGSNDVNMEYGISLLHDRVITVLYSFCTLALTVGAAADGANLGRVYIENDPDSTVQIAVTKVRFKSSIGSALATPSSPVIALRKFTFTGNTPSGATIGGARFDTLSGTKDANWNIRTAATGMTITEGNDVATFFPVSAMTASGAVEAADQQWVPGLDRPFLLRTGDGLMVKQVDAGTAGDTRRFSFEFEIEEYTAIA